MGKFIDKTGQKFGKLTVIKKAYVKNHKNYWLCKCECGNETVVRGDRLITGNTKSCGCLSRHNSFDSVYRHCNDRLFEIWRGMKKRCYLVTDKDFTRYGGRGITICNAWKNNFDTFYAWSIANGYKDNLSIDRIDNNGNYEPNNCRWASIKEQNRNKSNCRFLTYNNETHCLTEWAEILDISIKKIYTCLKRGEDLSGLYNVKKFGGKYGKCYKHSRYARTYVKGKGYGKDIY